MMEFVYGIITLSMAVGSVLAVFALFTLWLGKPHDKD